MVPAGPIDLTDEVQTQTQTLAFAGAPGDASGRHELRDPLIGQRIAGCLVMERLGQGGMGRVFRAHHQGLNKPVAVKVLNYELVANPTFVERFLREAQAAARLDHPNVVQILNAGEDANLFFIVMQFVDGETLAARLRRERRLDPGEAMRVTAGVLSALAAAHELGIVHRDIKPDNVMLDAEGAVKVADFGLARNLAAVSDLTSAGLTCGTPPYMAPEQIMGRTVDGRADLYSVGVLLYECLAGRRPFECETLLGYLEAHTRLEPEPLRRQLPELPAEVEEFTGRLLAKAPEDRYGNAAEALRDLQLIAGDALQATPPSRRSSRLDLAPSGTRRLYAILGHGIDEGATSLHIEPCPGGGRVRLRLRNHLVESERLSPGSLRQLIDACRSASGHPGQIDDEPLEGIVEFEHDRQRRQAKLSLVPTQQGPRAALRLLGLVKPHQRLAAQGFATAHIDQWRNWIADRPGLVAVTGPAGSGKGQLVGGLLGMLTLNTCLTIAIAEESMVDSDEISQLQVTHKMTRLDALRLALRQYPDLILLLDVHGIPDRGTAHEAFQAAATGKRLLASLMYEGTADTIANFLGMGLDHRTLARSLTGIIAPRLVRVVCQHCREAYEPTPATLLALALTKDDGPFMRAVGCAHCARSDGRRRLVAYESFAPTPAFWDELGEARQEADIAAVAARHGLISMRDQLLPHVRKGRIDPANLAKGVLPGVG